MPTYTIDLSGKQPAITVIREAGAPTIDAGLAEMIKVKEELIPGIDHTLSVDELVVGTEYDVQWDDDSRTEGSFRSVLVEKGDGVTRWANGVVLCGEPICYFSPSISPEPDGEHDAWLLQRMKR